MKPVPRIPVCRLNHSLNLSAGQKPEITLASPAESVFWDFDSRSPMLINPAVSVDDAAYLMHVTHSKIKLVVDARNRLSGIISLRDIESVKVLATASAMGVERKDLTVKDIMTPVVLLHGIQRETLERSRVRDLLDVLEFEGQHYLLILDGQSEVCGLVSAEEISHRLGQPVNIEPVVHNFSDVFTALNVSNH
ncbi:CBS domain-containing protein [Gilvimarinus agarilyticus]|uniref:CBS domain-containing protein n=1 Tax=unclassified Gilvimarinus TaxID=2642066 RepID=UPI001C094A65|nr:MULTISPECIES: CBS domain-containing protein [unclassified Gilvimarinus]MBU2887660.1 CBS domain-containing protein [Gilvimarinus agarilyticus]MDO6572309.1 CBS domain-containing protein [Gilvimarinus sp. 2_MG-2023]MDO6746481.1 CBS domain-containing protein [Gilvimarinus sp. 1_MG-2023]